MGGDIAEHGLLGSLRRTDACRAGGARYRREHVVVVSVTSRRPRYRDGRRKTSPGLKRPVMEEAESGGREPEPRCAEQTELLSLIISGEEEATPEESELGGKGEKTSVIIVAEWVCAAVRATAIVPQPVTLCQGQCQRAAWPLCLCGSYKQRLKQHAGRRTHTLLPPSGQ